MKTYIFLFILLGFKLLHSQSKNPFNGFLPIRETPELNYSSAMVETEPLIFEAEPVLYFDVYNTYQFYDSLFHAKKAEALYFYFNSHFRMFQGRSKPVRMPSYKLFLGWQRSIEVGDKASFTLAIETGHYSNGQSGCAWSDTLVDGTKECNELAKEMLASDIDLSRHLNRINGNFSTNLSKLRLQYVTPRFRKETKNVHRIRTEYTFNHNGFAMFIHYNGSKGFDLDFIGTHTLDASYEWIRYTEKDFRYSIKQDISHRFDAHPSIEPWRLEITLSIFPADWVTAFFFTFIYGHDDYNYRIVDSGIQYSAGVRWDLFQLEEFR